MQSFKLVLAILTLSCIQADAGYTHYYIWKQSPNDASLKSCVADMNRLIEARKSILVSPDRPESTPGSLKLNATNVDFNGIGDHACEPFVFPFVFSDRRSFNFCKTQAEPYDEVVTACLVVARDHFPPAILEIKSDGTWGDWNAGAKLYSSVIGRSARNPMSNRGITDGPAGLVTNLLSAHILLIAIVVLVKKKRGTL